MSDGPSNTFRPIEPPISILPGIKKIPATPHHKLRKSVEYVRTIYNPPVRGSQRRKARSPSSHATAPGDAVRKLNAFERSYVIRWLTSVVVYLSGVLAPDDSQMEVEESVKKKPLLAICAGTASAGGISRVFTAHSPLLASLASSASTLNKATSTSSSSQSPSYLLTNTTSREETGTISINLRDVPLDNQDYGTVGAQTWGWACVMAEMVVEDSARFGLLPLDANHHLVEGVCERQKPFRILELRAGTGLVSLAIASFYQALLSRDPCTNQLRCRRRDMEIVATDYYPSVLENLEVNLKSNGFGSAPDETNAVASTSIHSSNTVPSSRSSLDWSTFSSPQLPPPLASSTGSPLDEPFDMAFGADIEVYEKQHAVWIKAWLKKLFRKPLGAVRTAADSADEGGPRNKGHHDGDFHLIIPLNTHSRAGPSRRCSEAYLRLWTPL
ncbi:hypothetical protein BKA70DRAFT_1436984 [Coprinopsis sp. MPI-PUGE-AT-0042]|nr:hypothetical protein BKA70DRAFT_1436984 [Coprinopsis sp. MPI-PUGE-AT-0042]